MVCFIDNYYHALHRSQKHQLTKTTINPFFLSPNIKIYSQPDKFKPEPSNIEEKNAVLKAKHNDKFVKVSQAYDILSDEKKRNAYDKYGQNGLDMLEKGIDPEEAGFGGGAGGGGGGFGGGFPGGGFPGGGSFSGGGSFNNADAFKMFNGMFGKVGSGGGGGGGFGGGFDFGNMFGGGGGFGGGHQQQQRQQNTQPVFPKDGTVVPLGKPKFPDTKAKNAWLILFYDKTKAQRGSSTEQHISHAFHLAEGLLKKAKSKNGMIFKVGAVECSTEKSFCEKKLGKDVDLPRFATVLNGRVQPVNRATATSPKKLHDHTTQAMRGVDGLVINVNSMKHIQERLLSASGTPGHPTVSILLLSDKYETSPIYASLSYKHRHDGFVAFGESRGSNSAISKEFPNFKEYPTLLALIGNTPLVDEYTGSSFDLESLSKWIERLASKHLKKSSSASSRTSGGDRNKKKQRVQ